MHACMHVCVCVYIFNVNTLEYKYLKFECRDKIRQAARECIVEYLLHIQAAVSFSGEWSLSSATRPVLTQPGNITISIKIYHIPCSALS